MVASRFHNNLYTLFGQENIVREHKIFSHFREPWESLDVDLPLTPYYHTTIITNRTQTLFRSGFLASLSVRELLCRALKVIVERRCNSKLRNRYRECKLSGHADPVSYERETSNL